MTAVMLISTARSRPRDRTRDALAAVAAAIVMLAVQAAGGFATLSDAGSDNDSLLRLVQIRDLIAGQGWFDLHQYRMGPEGGFVMHWSRLIDAPIAALMLAASAILGSSAGEAAALLLWPFLLSALCMYFLLRAARRFRGEDTLLPAAVLGAAALHFVGLFRPATLDHHNVQLTLAFAMLTLLLASGRHGGLLAGACAALMIAVGMETVPYVAAAGVAVSWLFLTDGEAETARGFGVGLALVGAMAFVVTVPPSQWNIAACDAYSVVQFALAGIAGAGLAAITLFEPARRTPGRRAVALAALGAAVAAVALLAFPHCLADPYASLDPRLRTYWLDLITEAQPLWSIVRKDPGMIASHYLTPALALIVLAAGLRSVTGVRERLIVGALLGMAILVSVWQVRGSVFSLTFAVLPLSAWIGSLRRTAQKKPGRRHEVAALLAWLVSFNLVWVGAVVAVRLVLDKESSSTEVAAPSRCTSVPEYGTLAAMPATRVMAVSNLGAPILRNTGHSVLAGPYHRNVTGNLAALTAFMGNAAEAEAVIRENAVTLVVFCPGNDETRLLADFAPQGLAAVLARGQFPQWLEPLAGNGDASLKLFKVRPVLAP